jgi:ATP adenylyltransferase
MHAFESELHFIRDGGVEFVVRRATRFPKGETAEGRSKDAPQLPGNPFLSPEPDLVVAEIGTAHIALLNKFNVVRDHVLLVTREYVDQHAPLDENDFRALCACMADARVLAFYNGGPTAGASQPHKHLQLVTLPLSPHAAIPTEPLVEGRALPFRHAVERLAPGDISRPDAMLAKYHAALEAAGLRSVARHGVEWQPQPYNLLVTESWMLAVPRTRDKFGHTSINSLAFAGSFFVRDERQLEAIERAGPMAVLKSVSLVE